MKKVSCVVIYYENRLINVTVNYKGSLTKLLSYDELDYNLSYKYESFNDMYKSVLNILKNNKCYVSRYSDFGATFHDIMWIEMFDYNVNKYGLK